VTALSLHREGDNEIAFPSRRIHCLDYVNRFDVVYNSAHADIECTNLGKSSATENALPLF
jgi:hypothetical protein